MNENSSVTKKVVYLVKALVQLFVAGVLMICVYISFVEPRVTVFFVVPMLVFGYLGVLNLIKVFSSQKTNNSAVVEQASFKSVSTFDRITQNQSSLIVYISIFVLLFSAFGPQFSIKLLRSLAESLGGTGIVPGTIIFLSLSKPFFEIAFLFVILRGARTRGVKVFISVLVVILFTIL
jgi:hypothetical protein